MRLRLLTLAAALAVIAGACTTPQVTTGDGPRVMWTGDSGGWSLALASNIAPPLGIAINNKAQLACGVAYGDVKVGSVWDAEATHCPKVPWQWLEALDEFHPQVVVVQIGAWEVFDRRPPGGPVYAVGTPEWWEWLRSLFRDTTNWLSRYGARVVWLTSPHFHRAAALDGRPDAHWTEASGWRVDLVNELIRQHVSSDPARNRLIDLAGWLDAAGLTDYARVDGVHYDADLGRATPVLQWLAPQLRAIAAGA